MGSISAADVSPRPLLALKSPRPQAVNASNVLLSGHRSTPRIWRRRREFAVCSQETSKSTGVSSSLDESLDGPDVSGPDAEKASVSESDESETGGNPATFKKEKSAEHCCFTVGTSI
jgi:hypothetical protein